MQIQYWLAAILAFAIGIGSQAAAAELRLLAPLGNFTIRVPEENARSNLFYSETGASPKWTISQWSIPQGRLSPFRLGATPDISVSTAPGAMVRVVRSIGGESVELS